MASQMPDLRRTPQIERAAVKAAWLSSCGIAFHDDVAGIERAWDAERKKMNQHAVRQRERAVHDRSTAARLPSSEHRAQRRIAQRNAEEGRQLFGLFVDVPWSAWDGYDEGTGQTQRGMVWDYNRDTKKFTIRFAPDGDFECDDIGLTWQELLGETPCLESAGERATWSEPHLLDFPNVELRPQPRGHRPRDAVWDQRKGAWVECTGHKYHPGMISLIHACAPWSFCSQRAHRDHSHDQHSNRVRLNWRLELSACPRCATRIERGRATLSQCLPRVDFRRRAHHTCLYACRLPALPSMRICGNGYFQAALSRSDASTGTGGRHVARG